jgi:hypothetical protein
VISSLSKRSPNAGVSSHHHELIAAQVLGLPASTNLHLHTSPISWPLKIVTWWECPCSRHDGELQLEYPNRLFQIRYVSTRFTVAYGSSLPFANCHRIFAAEISVFEAGF